MAQKKKQKIITGFVCLSLLLLVGILYYAKKVAQTAQVRVDDLSERAKEFIEEEKKKSGSSWKTVDFIAPEASQSANVPKHFSLHCFELQMPITTHSENVTDTENTCTVKMKTNSPPGWLVITAEQWPDTLEEHANVSMRLKLKDEYSFVPTSIEPWDETLFFSQKDGAVLFLKQSDLLLTLALSQMTQPERATPELLSSIANGIELHQ